MPLDIAWKNTITDSNFAKVRKTLSHDFTADILDLLSDKSMPRRELSNYFDCHESTLYRRVDSLEEIDLIESQNNFSNLHIENSDNRVETLYTSTPHGEEVLETYNSLIDKYDFDTVIGNDNTCYLLGTVESTPRSEADIHRNLYDAGVEMSPRTVGRHLDLLADNGLIEAFPSYTGPEEAYLLTEAGEEVIKEIHRLYSATRPSINQIPSDD